MIDIKLEEASSLTLEMHIDGVDAQPELRFSVMVEGMRLSFPGRAISEGVYEIAFPQLDGRVPVGEYNAEVEVIVDGRHFSPLSETVNFTKEIKPQVSLREHMSKVAAPSIKISQIKKAAPLLVIENVQSLVRELSRNGSIDTVMALRCLDAMAAKKNLVETHMQIKPAAALSEAEAIVMLRLISSHGEDIISGSELAIDHLNNISENVSTALRGVLSDKGLSAKVLAQYEF